MKIGNFVVSLVFIICSCKYVTFVVTFIVDTHTSSLEYQKEAKISVNRIKRFDTVDSSEDPYSITIKAFDRKYHANIEKPRRSIFAPNFKFQTVVEDMQSNTITIKDATLTEDEMKQIEDGHYINSEKQASFSIRSLSDGSTRKIRGIIEDIAVTEFVSKRSSIATKISKDAQRKRKFNVIRPKVRDYLDPGPRPPRLGRTSTNPNLKAECEPELFIIYDNAIYKRFNGNVKEITDYTGILFHAVNNRFDTIAEVKIKFRITGVRATATAAAQSFMENHVTPDKSGYDIKATLHSFSEWIFKNVDSIPKHDLAIFISGEDFQMKDEKTGWIKNYAGLAWLGGACYNNKITKSATGTSVGEDDGHYSGLFTIAHELAHNLGADHDGDGASSDCDWKDGYIMSYLGYGTTNKFRFSNCSIRNMKKLVMSTQGDCLRNFEYKQDIVAISNQNVGQMLSMNQICQMLFNNVNATVDRDDVDPSTNCRRVHCKFSNLTTLPDGRSGIRTWRIASSHPAARDTPCGNGGKCWDGECLNHKKTIVIATTQKPAPIVSMKEVCQKIFQNENAAVDEDIDPSTHCKYVHCKFSNITASPDGRMGTMTWKTHSASPTVRDTPCGNGGKCSDGECLNHKKVVVLVTTQKPGPIMSMKELCQKVFQEENATVDADVDASTHCKNVHCTYSNITTSPDGRRGTMMWKTHLVSPTVRDTPCGNGGKCSDGHCLK